MARRRRPEKRIILPDPKFKDQILSKFMNNLMVDGKKSTAERIVYGAFDSVEAKAKKDPLQLFHDALNNVKPGIEVRSRRCPTLPAVGSVAGPLWQGSPDVSKVLVVDRGHAVATAKAVQLLRAGLPVDAEVQPLREQLQQSLPLRLQVVRHEVAPDFRCKHAVLTT